MPPPMAIPASSSSRPTSRLEYVLASFEDSTRARQGTVPVSSSATAGTAIATGSSPGGGYGYPVGHGPSSSHQPRVIRASSSTHDVSSGAVVLGSRPSISISPTRHRATSALILSRANVPPRTHSNVARSHTPFTPPTYLQNALLSNLIRGGPPPPQAHVPELDPTPELVSTMSDSEDSAHNPRRVHPTRPKHGDMSTKKTLSWPKYLSIPTKWNESDKSPHLIVSPNGKDVTFSGMPFSPAGSSRLIACQVTSPASTTRMPRQYAQSVPFHRLVEYIIMRLLSSTEAIQGTFGSFNIISTTDPISLQRDFHWVRLSNIPHIQYSRYLKVRNKGSTTL
jgi:hypothetical protein